MSLASVLLYCSHPSKPFMLSCWQSPYLPDDLPGEGRVWGVEHLAQKHGLEEGPGHSATRCVHHVQVEVHTEWG